MSTQLIDMPHQLLNIQNHLLDSDSSFQMRTSQGLYIRLGCHQLLAFKLSLFNPVIWIQKVCAALFSQSIILPDISAISLTSPPYYINWRKPRFFQDLKESAWQVYVPPYLTYHFLLRLLLGWSVLALFSFQPGRVRFDLTSSCHKMHQNFCFKPLCLLCNQVCKHGVPPVTQSKTQLHPHVLSYFIRTYIKILELEIYLLVSLEFCGATEPKDYFIDCWVWRCANKYPFFSFTYHADYTVYCVSFPCAWRTLD